jgi:hypothetical protein
MQITYASKVLEISSTEATTVFLGSVIFDFDLKNIVARLPYAG